MGHIFIFISVFFNALKGFSSKKVSTKFKELQDVVNLNIIRNLLCFLIGIITVLISRNSLSFNFSPTEFLILLISGASMGFFVISWIFAIRSGAYMLVSACSSASFIIPCLISFLVLNENITLHKIVSFFIILLALFFLLRYNTQIKGKPTMKQIIFLLLVWFSQGVNQSMQKLYINFSFGKAIESYTMYVFLFTTLTLLIFKFCVSFSNRTDEKNIEMKKNRKSFIKNSMIYIILMAVGLFCSSYFQTLAAKTVDSIILYPMTCALSLVAGSAMASIFFKEKFTKDSVIGIILVFIALIVSK